MKDIEKNISTLIQSQFPSFYNEEGELFIAFVKAYYEWLEENGNTLYHSRRLSEYSDIDRTLDTFIKQFKEQYLKNIVFTTDSNKQLFIKHALEFYKSKGSQRSIDLFFRLVYGIPAQVYVPADDIFRLSASEYTTPYYLEITRHADNINFVGSQITGALSGATAFVEKLIRKKINSQNIDVFFISNINKDFQVHEPISYSNNFTDSPRIIGSLSRFEVIAGGSGFAVGDIVDIDSTTTGAQAKGRVTEVTNVTGVVEFALVDGGWGFSTNAQVIVSERVLVVNNVIMANTSVPNTYLLFEKVSQPLANIIFTTMTGAFATKQVFQKYHSNGSLAANGRILAVTQNTVTKTGELLVNTNRGNVELGTSTIYITGNATYATVTSAVDKTATANVMGVSSNVVLYCYDSHGSFKIGDEVYQGNSTVEWANGTVYDAIGTSANLELIVSNVNGIFRPSVANIYTRASISTYAQVNSFSTTIGVYDVDNAFSKLESNYIRAQVPSGFVVVSTGGAGFVNAQALTLIGGTSAIDTANATATTNATGGLDRVTITSGLSNYIDNETLTINSGTSSTNATGVINIIPGSSTIANIELISEGSLAEFSVGDLSFEETVVVNKDLISSNNAANVYFTNTAFILDGTGSGISSNGYGFIKFPAGNINSIILDCLDISSKVVGTITEITGINKGTNYTLDPFVAVVEPAIVAQGANDYIFTVMNATGNFANGELIQQSRNIANVNILTVSNATSGNVDILTITDATAPFTLGEIIYQSNGTANIGYGTLQTSVITSNAGTMTIRSVSNGFSNGIYKVVGATSGANATVSLVSYNFFQVNEQIQQYSDSTTVVANAIVQSVSINPTTRVGSITINSVSSNFQVSSNSSNGLIRGTLTVANASVDTVNTANITVNTQAIIRGIANDSTIYVKRLSLANFFEVTTNSMVIGLSSGVSANLIAFDYDDTKSGINANVTADSTIANGHVVSLDLDDSGFGYANGDVLDFISQDGSRLGTTKLILEKQGKGEGYFRNQKGFLSQNSNLFDGQFYQEYSYQIISRLPFEKYSDMFKKVLHVAGTEVFGKVLLEEINEIPIEIANINLKTANVIFKNVANTEEIIPNLFVYQTNGSVNTATGYANSYPSAELVLSNTTVSYEIGATVYQSNTQVNAASGYLQYKSSNATHTTLYLSNTRGTFANTSNIESIIQRKIVVNPFIDVIMKTVTLPSNTTQSFVSGESIYQGSVGSETFIGTVIASNSSVIRVSTTSGSITNNATISSSNSSTTAIANGVTSTTFPTSQTVYQQVKTLFLSSVSNSFSNGESVYQYKHNSSVTANVYNVNTAIGKVVSVNSTSIQIVNLFGNFANNRQVYGATSNSYGLINSIVSQNSATGNVVLSNTTTLIIKDVVGTFASDRQIIGANSIANATSITSNTQIISESNIASVINILVISNTQGTFSANSTSNGVVVLYSNNTTAATANLTAVKIESL